MSVVFVKVLGQYMNVDVLILVKIIVIVMNMFLMKAVNAVVIIQVALAALMKLL